MTQIGEPNFRVHRPTKNQSGKVLMGIFDSWLNINIHGDRLDVLSILGYS